MGGIAERWAQLTQRLIVSTPTVAPNVASRPLNSTPIAACPRCRACLLRPACTAAMTVATPHTSDTMMKLEQFCMAPARLGRPPRSDQCLADPPRGERRHRLIRPPNPESLHTPSPFIGLPLSLWPFCLIFLSDHEPPFCHARTVIVSLHTQTPSDDHGQLWICGDLKGGGAGSPS